jgi:hypothetical protein
VPLKETAGGASTGDPAAAQVAVSRLAVPFLGASPWILGAVVAAIGLAAVPALAWLGAGLVAALSLSGSI